MVFMSDSQRASEIAKENAIDVGLHLNLDQAFDTASARAELRSRHARVANHLRRSRYSQLTYAPSLRRDFEYVYRAQAEEFERLYGRPLSHLDGHHHMHLCANLLVSRPAPRGVKMRRNFTFWPGEKSRANRFYRRSIDWWLGRKYVLPDFFFDLSQCLAARTMRRVLELARHHAVELMTHPIVKTEADYLTGPEFAAATVSVLLTTYSRLEEVKAA